MGFGLQSWVSEHKLTSIGAVWASAIGASMAYTRAKSPLKTSLRLIHARMHAQALTLAVLSGAAAYHYYEKQGVAAAAAVNDPSVNVAEREMFNHSPDLRYSDS